MNRVAFGELAGRMWDDIPAEAREGVERVTVVDDVLTHPDSSEVFTLGECVTQSWPDGYSEGAVRSELLLYHGSFAALADEDAAFDWADELWETILHELLHHREAAARQSGLDDFDWAEEQNRLRWNGWPFDPAFYTVVPAGPDGVVRLDSELFLETVITPEAAEAGFEWRDEAYTVRVPIDVTVAFVEVTNLAGGRLCLVVRRRRRWWRSFGRPHTGPPVELWRSALPASPNGGG
ncbi:MAG: hypothetical protein ACC682_12620 [Gemmatimonadota bacterium]